MVKNTQREGDPERREREGMRGRKREGAETRREGKKREMREEREGCLSIVEGVLSATDPGLLGCGF